MTKFSKPLNEILVEDFMPSLKGDGTFTKQQFTDWLEEYYPGFADSTVTNWLTRLTTNSKTRLNWPIRKGKDDVLFKVGEANAYRLFNKSYDLQPIYLDEIQPPDCDAEAEHAFKKGVIMDEHPPAIRILPMANNLQNEFPGCESIEDVQQKFFLDELSYRENGSYYYHKRGLQGEPGTVVLFQSKASIIASATLTGTERFEEPTEGDYDGCLYFDVETIRTFDPINADSIKQIWPSFKGFNQVRWDLNPKNYHEFVKRLTHVKQPEMSKPTQEACDLASPTERVHESIYRILRDSELARRVKILHNFECQICGHTIKLPYAGSYAESHHIQPLGQPHNGPDTIGNIICVCPNHHAELDYGVTALSLSSLRHAAGHVIDPRYIEYHNKNVLKS